MLVCQCYLYSCHWVSNQLQLRNTPYHISYHIPYHISCVITSIIGQVCSSGIGFDSIKVVSISRLGQDKKKYQIFSCFFTVNGLALDDRGNMDRFTGHSMRCSPSQKVHTVPGDYVAPNSISFGELFISNKEHWRESECSH